MTITHLRDYKPRRIIARRRPIGALRRWLLSAEGYERVRAFTAGLIVGLLALVLTHVGGK